MIANGRRYGYVSHGLAPIISHTVYPSQRHQGGRSLDHPTSEIRDATRASAPCIRFNCIPLFDRASPSAATRGDRWEATCCTFSPRTGLRLARAAADRVWAGGDAHGDAFEMLPEPTDTCWAIEGCDNWAIRSRCCRRRLHGDSRGRQRVPRAARSAERHMTDMRLTCRATTAKTWGPPPPLRKAQCAPPVTCNGSGT